MTFDQLRPVPATGQHTHQPGPGEGLQALYTLPGRDLTTPGTARRLVGAELADWGIPAESRETLEQITAELAANAVEHAPGDRITVHLAYVPHTVTLTVTGTDAAPAHLSARQADVTDERGRGLFLVEALATDWGCHTAPRAGVWARLDLHQPTDKGATAVSATATATSSDPDEPASAGTTVDDAAELAALIEAGGFWRLTPEWWPRSFEARPGAETLRAVEAGLKRLIS
ncbi:ATP-binding protein [Streptomyces sp. HUAS TT7]|uniref:ATP-binding protein n=1 Tax=Streptomyces sp. HUAS TT7 TaxID=3447507 RepID=UPI003F655714